MTGTPPKKWLEKIEDDQNVKGIGSLILTAINDIGRHLFLSHKIGPNMPIAWYNPTTGHPVLGPHGYFVPNISWTTTSAAALTLTCPAGHRYKVYYAGCRNATQATDGTLSGTIGGNAWTDFNQKNGVAMAVQSTIVFIGAGCQVYDGVAVVGCNALPFVWLNAGDTLTMTLATYAAGNNTEHMFLFEDYEV